MQDKQTRRVEALTPIESGTLNQLILEEQGRLCLTKSRTTQHSASFEGAERKLRVLDKILHKLTPILGQVMQDDST